MKRRLDKSSENSGIDAGGAKKRSRLPDVVSFVLPFVFVVLAVWSFKRPTEKDAPPYDVALEVLKSGTTAPSGETSPEQSDAGAEPGVEAPVEVASDADDETPMEETAPDDAAGEISEESQTPTNERTEASVPETVDVESEDPQENKRSVEEAERLLAQLEFQFENVKKSDETDVDSILAALATIRDAANDFVENAPAEISTRARQTLDEIQAFYRNIEAGRAFFERLKALDSASLDSDATRAFFDSVAREFPARADESSNEIDEYRRDFARVANSLDALRRVESWNAFIAERGEALERFYVSRQDADAALTFMRDYGALDGTPREVAGIARRERELEYAAQNEVATRRKVLLRIEAELARKYWTYRRDEVSFYYLPEPPRVGVNKYVANAQGEVKDVDIPQDAPEIAADESPQKSFLRELFARANEIRDETRAKDVALWYREWCEVLTEIQQTDRLDPILQYALFRDVANILASSDYYFAKRLEPLTRILNLPRLDDLSKVDVFQTEEKETRELRATARARFAFLPGDHLTVDKTTAQLDAGVSPIAWSYRRVGWLDRNFSGEWRCRRADDAPELVGELWIFLADDARGDDSASSSRSRWIKIGAINGRQTTVNLIASETPRGAIVFCRARTDRGTTVAKRSGVDRIFRR